MKSLRSIEAKPPVTPERLHGGKPILEPEAANPWESRVVLNPAAVLVGTKSSVPDAWGLSDDQASRLQKAEGACVMLYRAQGERVDDHAPSSLGFAVFTPELSLVMRRPEPVLRPEEAFETLGVEDPRCTDVDGFYCLYYTGYSDAETNVKICLATSGDLVTWEKHGPVEGDLNTVPNKNATLLPRPVNGKWLLLHRPMEGPDAMTIHLAESDSPTGPWRSRGKLLESFQYREFSRSWIGAGGPPEPLGNDRFVMIYHQGHYTEDGLREYDLAAALLDFSLPEPVVSRIEPLMRPTGSSEQHGDPELGVDNVIFTCANYRWGSNLVIPYAGADSRIFGAAIDLEELRRALEAPQ